MSDDFQYTLPFPPEPENEGLFDPQMGLPLSSDNWLQPIREIVKRNGKKEIFNKQKISDAIFNASRQAGIEDRNLADSLASAVTLYISKQARGKAPTVEQVSDAVETVLIQLSQPQAALAYVRYRDRRARIRRLRQGDMKGLLGELEEARLERESANAIANSLQVQTSQENYACWDRQKIVTALCLETGLQADLAELIAAEVETQIQNAGLNVLTTPLIRELVGAKLLEHGLVEENEQRRRLGVPLYDASRLIRGIAPETLGASPAWTDQALARAVKKEYALSEVFSSEVTSAHFNGSLFLEGLDHVDRLCSADVSIGSLMKQEKKSALEFHPAMIVARMIQFTLQLDAFFMEAPCWHAFNHQAAPLLEKSSDRDLAAFSRAVLEEFDFRAHQGRNTLSPETLRLHWSAPCIPDTWLQPGMAGSDLDDPYDAWESVARRLALKLLEIFEEGRHHGPYAAPQLEIILEPALFRHFEGIAFLRQAVRTSLKQPGIRFLLPDRSEDDAPAPAGCCENSIVSALWNRIILNTPGIALMGETEAAFFNRLESYFRLAVQAHREKRDFVEGLMGGVHQGPLSFPAAAGGACFPETGRFVIAVDGLYECAEIMAGSRPFSHRERLTFMEKTLTFLGQLTEESSKKEDMDLLLGANSNPEISKRFANLDISRHGNALKEVVKILPDTQECSYTPGVGFPESSGLTPFDKAQYEGTLHKVLKTPSITSLKLPVRHASEYTLTDLLKKIMYQTDCRGVQLSMEEKRDA
ncbi:MAG TPA: anaerobic ribonucleoside-triphosphate reductase [Candidatus Hydrogenedentes bacterium]|nr:anaerobic ribonucleoside-triphosphate reductase [Candidatus Hydrogenedentota bacterium]